MDDAFISFRYADNLATGEGLVWNPDERVEGYTNFLWVILMAGGLLIGLPPENFSIILAAVIHPVLLLLVFSLSRLILDNRGRSLIVMVLVGFNHTVAAFATSGLETSLQTALFLAAAYILTHGSQKGWTRSLTAVFSLVLNLALLTRPDSVILVIAALVGYFRLKRDINHKDLLILAMPFLLISVPYVIWKVNFYGSLLPNTFYAKIHDLSGIRFGLFQLYQYIQSYLLVPFIVILVWNIKAVFRDAPLAGYLGLFSLTWICYWILAGGDLMEFRVYAPVIPFILLLIVFVIGFNISEQWLRIALLAVLLFGSFHNRLAFGRIIAGWGVETTDQLTGHLTAPGENWIGIGKSLGRLFDGSDVSIAIGAAGAVPYYSRLKTVDFMGLNDRAVPRIGDKLGPVPGHRIVAPLEYLVDRRVNLVLNPSNLIFNRQQLRFWLMDVGWHEMRAFYINVDRPVNGELFNQATLIGLPIDNETVIFAWYLTPHPDVERVIDENNLRVVKLVRR